MVKTVARIPSTVTRNQPLNGPPRRTESKKIVVAVAGMRNKTWVRQFKEVESPRFQKLLATPSDSAFRSLLNL